VASTGQHVATASASVASSAVASSAPLEPDAPRPWRQLVTLSAWREAAEGFDAEFPEGPPSPELRYVRARMELALGRPAEALALLSKGLEDELPLLSDDVKAWRARCQLEVGPFDEAARYFAAQGDAASRLQAAQAEERAGALEAAYHRVDATVTLLARQKSRRTRDRDLLVRARARRAHLAEKLGKKRPQLVDQRWLCMEAPTSEASVGCDDALAALDEDATLSAADRFRRARALADDGPLDRALRELDLVPKAPGKQPSAAALTDVRGWAHYNARSYERAADLLAEAAERSAALRVKDAFYAARARSRAGDDDVAIAQYRTLMRTYPKTGYAEEARYLVARLEFIRGKYEPAEAAFTDYLKRHRRGRFVSTALFDRALCRMALGRAKEAAPDLARVSRLERSERRRALVDELRGVAAEAAGDRKAALGHFRGVIEAWPLSFAALAADARLRALGESPPPRIPPAPDKPPVPPLGVKLPPRAALLHSIGLDGEAEDAVRDQADHIIAEHAPRGHEALCETYALLSTARERYRHGQTYIRVAAVNHAPSDSTRWAWDCLYPRPFAALVEQQERRYGLPPGLLHAVMRQESGFMHDAVSPAAAHGLMQMIGPTAAQVAASLDLDIEDVDLRNPGLNVRMGAFYLARLMKRFGGRVALAAAAYNAGPQAASRWLEGGEKLPLDLFVAKIPYSETRKYVQRVVGNLARYELLAGGVDAVPPLELEVPDGLRALPEDY
jgi:soluble lytic murein transglycosylase